MRPHSKMSQCPYYPARSVRSIISNLEGTPDTDHGFPEGGTPCAQPFPRRLLSLSPFRDPAAHTPARALCPPLCPSHFLRPPGLGQGSAWPAPPERWPRPPVTLLTTRHPVCSFTARFPSHTLALLFAGLLPTLPLEDSPLGGMDLTCSLLCPNTHTTEPGTRLCSAGVRPTGPGAQRCSRNT